MKQRGDSLKTVKQLVIIVCKLSRGKGKKTQANKNERQTRDFSDSHKEIHIAIHACFLKFCSHKLGRLQIKQVTLQTHMTFQN